MAASTSTKKTEGYYGLLQGFVSGLTGRNVTSETEGKSSILGFLASPVLPLMIGGFFGARSRITKGEKLGPMTTKLASLSVFNGGKA